MIHFVGAGCGAPDLITVRGVHLLEKADVIIYAGSLVNPKLLDYAKADCQVYNSAVMTLEEVLAVMVEAEQEGKDVVRLHTGEPSIYGAVQEQMQKLEKERKEAEGRRNPLSESKNRLMEFGAEQKERLTEFGAEQKERFAALGFDVRSDKMPDLKELLERFDQMTKPQLPTNWLMRLTTKRYLRAYPHLQGTHHASLKKEEKKAEEKEEKK